MPVPEVLTHEQLEQLTGWRRTYIRQLIYDGTLTPLPRTGPRARFKFPLRTVSSALGIPRSDLVSWLRENFDTVTEQKGAA